MPVRDYIPLVALLRRRLSDDEVVAVATELISTGGAPVQGTDVRVATTKLTDDLPSPEDTERVKRRLCCGRMARQRSLWIAGIATRLVTMVATGHRGTQTRWCFR